MSEQQMPARIWACRPGLWTEKQPQQIQDSSQLHAFVRADIVDRMAEALERTLSWLTSYPGEGALGAYEQARSALSAFKDSAR